MGNSAMQIGFNGRALSASYTLANLTVKASYVQYKLAGSFNNAA